MPSPQRTCLQFAVCSLLVLAGAAQSAAAQGSTGFTNFTLLYPGANNLMYAGANFAIKWTGGNAGTPPNIFLMKKTPYSVIATVATNVPNTGMHAWSVPKPGGPIPIFCGHEYAFSVTTLAVPTTTSLGPWFKIVCGEHNLRISSMTRTGSGLRIMIRNAGPLSLPAGAMVQLQTTLAPGLTVTSIYPPAQWTCTPPTATGPASMTCSIITTAPVLNGSLVQPIRLLTSGSPSSQSCSTVTLLLKNNAGQYVVAPEATSDDNQACAQ